MIERIPVASVVAKGDYEVGFQQVAELLPIPGVTFVAKIPEDVQSVTRYAAGIPVNAEHPKEAKALLDYLASRRPRLQCSLPVWIQFPAEREGIFLTSCSNSRAAGVKVLPRRLISPTLRITSGATNGTLTRNG